MARKLTKANNGTRRLRRTGRNIITTVVNTGVAVLGNPLFMIAIAVSLYLYTSPNLIQDFCKKFYSSEILKPIFTYISNHAKQTAGFILAGTAALTGLPARYSFAGFIILGVIIYTCPQADYLEYFLLTAFTLLFIRLRNIRARIIVVVLIILTLAIGWWGQKLWKLQDCSKLSQSLCSSYACKWSNSQCVSAQ